MSATFNGSDGRPVIAVDTAETIGEIKGFVVDPTATRIDSVHISGRGKKAELISWSSIQAFGADAVMANMATAAEQVVSEHETQAVKGKIVARDTRVLDSAGFEQGTVEDVMFDTESGELTGALTTQGHIDAARFRSLGSYALVIEAE